MTLQERTVNTVYFMTIARIAEHGHVRRDIENAVAVWDLANDGLVTKVRTTDTEIHATLTKAGRAWLTEVELLRQGYEDVMYRVLREGEEPW